MALANVRAALAALATKAAQAAGSVALASTPLGLSKASPPHQKTPAKAPSLDANTKQIARLNRQRVEAARRVRSLSIVLSALRPASQREYFVSAKFRNAERDLAQIDAELAQLGTEVSDAIAPRATCTAPIADAPKKPPKSATVSAALAKEAAHVGGVKALASVPVKIHEASPAVRKPSVALPSPDAGANEIASLNRLRIEVARRVRSFTVVSAKSREAERILAQIDVKLASLSAAMIDASSPPAAQTSPPTVDRPKPFPESTTPITCHLPTSQSGKLTLERDMLADQLQHLEASQAKFFPGSRKSEKNRSAREDLVQRIAASNIRIARGDKFPAFKIVPPRIDLRGTAGSIEAQRDALRSELQELERRGTDASDGPDRMEVYRARRAQMLWRISQLDARIAAGAEAAKAGA